MSRWTIKKVDLLREIGREQLRRDGYRGRGIEYRAMLDGEWSDTFQTKKEAKAYIAIQESKEYHLQRRAAGMVDLVEVRRYIAQHQQAWEDRVQALEEEGCTRSDAQSVADVEFAKAFAVEVAGRRF